MWELADVFRGDWEDREGWGWHNLEDWDLFLTTIYDIGQLTRRLPARTSSSTTASPAANDFDHEQVKNDAESFELSESSGRGTQPEEAEATPTP